MEQHRINPSLPIFHFKEYPRTCPYFCIHDKFNLESKILNEVIEFENTKINHYKIRGKFLQLFMVEIDLDS